MTAHSPLQSAQVAAPPAATDQPGRTAGPSDLTDTRVGPEWTAESQSLASSLTSTFSDQMAEGATALAIWEGEGGPSVAEPPELSDQGTRRGGLPVGLDWSAFSARLFPGRRRHDLEALKAYEAYRNLSESETNYCLTDARATGHAELERPESIEIVTKTANVKLPSQPYVKTSTRRRFYGSPAAG